MMNDTIHILSFDIEEWFLFQERYGKDLNKYGKLDKPLKQILELLDNRQMKGTFFCLGGMAKDFPELVKEIDKRGHEIGCHSNTHKWLNKMSYMEVKEDTRISIDTLEQCIGKKIKSYRAPAFSIGSSNKWAFEILAENGITNDASVFPVARDFGGFPNFGYKTPVTIKSLGVEIREYPVCTTRVLGKELAYSGGGYFRFFPSWFVNNEIKKSKYVMTYFHIADLIPESNNLLTRKEYEAYFKEPGTFAARYKRYVKSNLGKNKALQKLINLICFNDFISIEQANNQIDWSKQPIVNI